MTEIHLNRRVHTLQDVETLAAKYRTWGLWGAEDQLGAANRVTPETVARAAATMIRGAVFSLALPLDRSGPQGGSKPRVNPQHVMLLSPTDGIGPAFPRQGFSDDAVYMPLQAATQWDALCHAFFDGWTYNGRGTETVTVRSGAAFNSITNFKDRAIGRGVLLDLPRWRGRAWLEPGEAIQAEDLEACAAAQGVVVGEADFVLVRTGQLAQIRDRDGWADYAGGPAPGLGLSAADFLCSRGVTGVATDTWGAEVMPYETADVFAPLHVVLLVNAGIYIGEMWDLEVLAKDCATDGVFEFFLSAQPLTVTGSVGSPVNPVAVK